ncbi:MAG: carbamoyltransferase C-terminal domain-containing protein [Bryobacteraceae bacterium]
MNTSETILGLNAFHGDSSAALFRDGDLKAAVEEERFNRIKHWAGLPVLSANACLRMAGLDSVDHIAISRDPRANVVSKAIRALARPGVWRHSLERASNSVRVSQIKDQLIAGGVVGASGARLHYVEHHRAHMASAFFASPFEEAAVISIDGFGDFSSVMWGVGRGNEFDVRGSVRFPHSLGLFYTAFTQLLGFPKYGDEYKMMGLGAYGFPRYADRLRQIVKTEKDQVRLNLDYFRHHTEGVEMTWEGGEPKLGKVYSPRLEAEFGKAREPREEIQEYHRDLAASAQAVLEENYFALLNYVQKKTGLRAVCLAGGVALNCVANGMIFERSPFRDVYVQPAAHDAGTSIGAALYVQHQVLGRPRSFVMRHVYYGTAYDDAEIRSALESVGAAYERLDQTSLARRTAAEIADGKIVGWFQGRMEFGPRALGGRSILADPRRADMKDILNRRIKYREPFRPFCPSVLAERCGEFFEQSYPSPFMVMAYRINPEQRSRIPAVTHEDGTGRLQTVERGVNERYWSLIREFEILTGVPILLNTSFNENEPIVDTPAQAIDCFFRTNMDVLAIGPYFLDKRENSSEARTKALSEPGSVLR